MSIGVARTKHLAKIASQVAKPDGLVVVDPETELEFLHELPVALMWGVGPATEARLAKIGVTAANGGSHRTRLGGGARNRAERSSFADDGRVSLTDERG
jgi:nucleotidyltransferase/DNA polymerase involved in DNA repair